MISNLEKEITLRFLKARKNDGFLNVISIFSFIGISLGVAVLIIVMSVMNGFRTELINMIVGFNSHITVQPYNDVIIIDDKKKQNLKFISKNLILSNSGEAIIIKNEISKGIILRGYRNNDFSKLSIIDNDTFVGNSNKLEKNYISIGKELSFTLDLKIGDNITLMSSAGQRTRFSLRGRNCWPSIHRKPMPLLMSSGSSKTPAGSSRPSWLRTKYQPTS